jgi:hypothetical protein
MKQLTFTKRAMHYAMTNTMLKQGFSIYGIATGLRVSLSTANEYITYVTKYRSKLSIN